MPPREQLAHLTLSRRAAASGGAAAEARVRSDRNAAEIVVAARDRRALFADLALTIARSGGNVVGARIFTSSAGEALDIFHVQDGAGRPFGGDNPRALAELLETLEASGRGEPPPPAPAHQTLLARPSPFTIAAAVAIDNEASQHATVIEASGRDRPGLLEALARTISDADLSIQSAHIDHYGERAVDAFYVVTSDGEKLTDPVRLAELHARLTERLDAADPITGRLPKARASAAR